MTFQLFFTVISVLLILAILFQQKNSSLGSMMGGDSGEELAQTRRGAEKVLHNATVLLACVFIFSGIYAMLMAV